MNYKHVVIRPESFTDLEFIAKLWGLDKGETVEYLIRYFKITGDDPTATKKDNTAVSIKRLENTVVSFIRKHETEHLEKIVSDFEETRKAFEQTANTLTQSNDKQTAEIKTAIDTGRKDNKDHINYWMINGIKLKDGEKFSVKDRLDKGLKNDEYVIKLFTEMEAKNEKKKQVIFTRMESMKEEIKEWGAITKDANRGKATAHIDELKTLVDVQY
jgi:hypothetical protein